MKKKSLLTGMLALVMVLASMILPSNIKGFGTLIAQAAESYEAGDINLDGDIDYLDAMMALRYDADLVDLSDTQMSLGDVNSDGAVDSLDAILILRYDAGLIDEFPESSNSTSSTDLVFCSAEEAVYVLNTNTKKIHYPGCRWVSTIHDENLAYYNGDIEDLIAAGYTACKTCDP